MALKGRVPSIAPETDWAKIFRNRLANQASSIAQNVGKGTARPAVHAQPSLAQKLPSLVANVQVAPRLNNPEQTAIIQRQLASSGGGKTATGTGGGGSAPIQPSTTSAPKATAAPAASGKYPATPKDNTFGYKGVNVLRSGKINDSRNWFAGKNSNIAIQDLASDPEQINYQWTKAMGYGRGIESQLNRYVDPYAIGLAMGQNFATDEDYLGFVGGFNERATSASTGQSTFDPRAILRRVFGSSGQINTDAGTTTSGAGSNMDVIGQKLYGGANAGNASAQVGDTLKFLQSVLTGVVSPVVLDSYLALIEEQGRAFLAYKNSPEGGKSADNFGAWILKRLGTNAGL